MIRTRSILYVVILLFTVVPLGYGAYLEEDYKEKAESTVRIVPPEPPRKDNEITRLISRISVGRPYRVRNLMVFPLYVSRTGDDYDYKSLDEAIDRGYLDVLEKGEGRVSEISVENKSKYYIFLMAGEIIGGGKQNRVIAADVLLRPHSGMVSIPVYCVERGRWVVKTKRFYSENTIVTNKLRKLAQEKNNQADVWKEVTDVASANRVSSKTGNFQEIYADEEVQKRIKVYEDGLIRLPRRTVGIVATVNNRIVGADIFCNEKLFDKLWRKLLKANSLDAVTDYDDAKKIPSWLDRKAIAQFLNRVYRAGFFDEDGVDLGKITKVKGNGLDGAGLIYDGEVIHLNLVPEKYVMKVR